MRRFLRFGAVAAIVAADQLTKAWAERALQFGESIVLLPPVVQLTLVHNRGAAFGLMQHWTLFFLAIAACTVGFVGYLLWTGRTGVPKASLVLLLGGAVGNAIDRVRLGYVIDFIDFRVWPVFNLADTAITCGMLLLVAALCFGRSAGGTAQPGP